ncbi:MAG: hypothetical protein JSS07_10865 [Proteobacteria bacterium]|nr:hypothetical protein [Pseudomonadota bacterium]
MSHSGPRLNINEIFSKYNPKHLEKFKAIAAAEDKGQDALVNELMNNLSPQESAEFDNFLEDLSKIGKYQDLLEAEMQQNDEKIKHLDRNIATQTAQRDQILNQYKNKITDEVTNFNNTSKEPANKPNGKKKVCTIL